MDEYTRRLAHAGETMNLRRLLLVLLMLSMIELTGCGTFGTWVSTPGKPWDEMPSPPAPDYADESSWAARPGMNSRATQIPPGVPEIDPQITSRVDVFFLHPTTYFWRSHWNAPIGGWLTHTMTAVTLAGQAGAFNGTGQIYAPRYRQMTLQGYQHPEARVPALDLAYKDVRNAFEYFLEHDNKGKPIILAAHSQGSDLLLRLNREFFGSGPLRERLIASYPVGTRIYHDSDGVYSDNEYFFEHGHPRNLHGQTPAKKFHEPETVPLPVCKSANEIGCMVTWRSFARGANPNSDIPFGLKPRGTPLCVNPLTWERSAPSAPPSANLGTIPLPYLFMSRPEPDVVGAACEDGALWINPPPRGILFLLAHPDGNYHAYDYELFYMNLRKDAARRTQQFFKQHPPH